MDFSHPSTLTASERQFCAHSPCHALRLPFFFSLRFLHIFRGLYRLKWQAFVLVHVIVKRHLPSRMGHNLLSKRQLCM
jgi:hypothetical protein